MSYKAVVSRIFVRSLECADNLQIGNCGGYQVLVGKDVVFGVLEGYLKEPVEFIDTEESA